MVEKIYAILLAGGSGTRMGADRNKVLLEVGGIPCIVRSARALANFADHLIVVYHAGEAEALRDVLEKAGLPKPFDLVLGGDTRQQSVHHGLQALQRAGTNPEDLVLIHDGARCLVDAATIKAVLDSVRRLGAGVAAVPVTDTLRGADEHLLAGATIPREGLWAMQTPQGFRFGDLLSAFDLAARDGFEGTDDAAVMAHAGFPVYLAGGSRNNLKLTTREDLKMAEAMIRNEKELCPFRVGQGYDVHQLVEGRKLILCGVEIPHEKGLLGHSDADVALHALMDALLGAAGLGDIGRHFPDSDPRYKGIDSMKLLAVVMEKLHAAGFRPGNVDVTIVAQRPKLASFIPQMAENLAQALDLPLSRINVKATTTERLGFEGRMEGISAQAVCLIQPV